MNMGPKTVNGGETGYDIKSARRWMRKWGIIGGSTLTLLGGGGGIVGSRMFSQDDVDRATAHANSHLQVENDVRNLDGEVEAMQHNWDERLQRFEDAVDDLKTTSDELKTTSATLLERTKDL